MTRREVRVPVFVAGAGPAGLTTAALLAGYGVDVLAISKYSGTANTPRAHITNQRAVEVFRDMGLEDRLNAIAAPSEMMANCVWATSLAGVELARLNAWGNGDEDVSKYRLASPSRMCNAPQHVLEPLLLEAAQEKGARVEFDTELLSMEQSEHEVRSRVRNRQTGEEFDVVSDFAVGADGAQSVVVRDLGFAFEGEMGRGHAVNCWFEADLTKLCAHRPGVLYLILQPENDNWIGSGTFVCVRPWTEWVLLSMYDPAHEEREVAEASVLAKIKTLIDDESISVRIKSISKWTVNSMYAREMVKGRVAIAGDAAHRHPPSGGMGSNTAVQDAFNLAWKLALIVEGKAPLALLQSYCDERQPVAKQVVMRAVTSMVNMQPVPQAFGFVPGQSADEGWASVKSFFSPTEVGKKMRKDLAAALELQNWQFNGIGGELGQFYTSRAVLADGPGEHNPEKDRTYAASSTPGATVPHAWLEIDRRRVSSLDLVGKGVFTVLTGPGGEGWTDAAAAASERFGVTVKAVQIGGQSAVLDVYGRWAQVRGIEENGCLLIRPDRFVAFRASTLVADPIAILCAAMEHCLVKKISQSPA